MNRPLRARDAGFTCGSLPAGILNSIADVPGVRVGHRTLVDGDIRTGVTAIVPQRRGQILGFDSRPGWDGWDVVEAIMPQAEMRDLIIELRSATAGVASYRAKFDHMAELTGRIADEVMQASGKAA